jgi:hypothetical protein
MDAMKCVLNRTDMHFVDEVFACSLSGDVIRLLNVILHGSGGKKHWVDCRSKCGDTPLHVAARCVNLEFVRCVYEQFQFLM